MSIETIILRDDFLRGDLHRDGAQGYAHHLLERNEDERESRPAHALKFSEKKYDAALVLPQHAKRADEIYDYRNADNAENMIPLMVFPLGCLNGSRRRQSKTCRLGGLVSSGAAARGCKKRGSWARNGSHRW
jgi:hypothetical protein